MLACQGALADTSKNTQEYGFDWHKPQSAKCREITQQIVKNFKSCEPKKSRGAFGLDMPYRICATTANGEYLIYENKKNCQQALETMEANAP
jgi:hypothetical protein